MRQLWFQEVSFFQLLRSLHVVFVPLRPRAAAGLLTLIAFDYL